MDGEGRRERETTEVGAVHTVHTTVCQLNQLTMHLFTVNYGCFLLLTTNCKNNLQRNVFIFCNELISLKLV